MSYKKIVSILLIISCLFMIAANTEKKELPRVMSYIAVMELAGGKEVDKELISLLTDVVIEELVHLGDYTVIDRANRDEILSEVGFQMTGCVEEKCTVEAGKILGVGKIVVGSVAKISGTYVVRLQLINIETATIEAATSQTYKGEVDGLIESVRIVTQKLTGKKTDAASTSSDTLTSDVLPGNIPKPESIVFIPATAAQKALCEPAMVYVPAGWFMMGCNSEIDKACDTDESPYHAIYLNAFCIDKYEYPNKPGVKPLEKVKWQDAQGYCSSQGKQLPTEAQWEKAARATNGRIFPWGDEIDAEKEKLLKRSYLSGALFWNVSQYGAYDMAGNVSEWTSDWYKNTYYDESPNKNPIGPSYGKDHSLRGGSVYDYLIHLRSSARVGLEPSRENTFVGFRCVKKP